MISLKKAQFLTSIGSSGEYLKLDAPQIAIVGKSNVGKSSFINAICNNHKLAKTSSTPGKTRLINYFSINDGQFYLVDLPGYGFAKAPKDEQKKWGELIEGYLKFGQLNHIFLLVDSRHDPTVLDKLMFSWIQHYCIPYTIIATKVDKHAKSKRQQAANAVSKHIGAISPAIGFSTPDKFGIIEVWTAISSIVEDFYDNLSKAVSNE